MSMILDALRKMEQDRRMRRQAGSALRPEVLSYRGRSSKSPRLPVVPLFIGILLVAAGAGVGLWVSSREKPAPLHPAVQDTQAVKVPEVLPPVRPAQPPAPQPLPPLPTPATATPPPVPVRKGPVAAPLPRTVEPAGTAGITISGIAWQDERELRRAVVNGALVGEGADVGGARVVEIKENRVRFSRGGQVFDVLYSSAFPRQ
ncbi:hypothetical protein [Geomobilimonas luticola]|uniref:General secretion pathway protein B n=1 Tax=Geomobilimonas luticola TaxID=1114878 RepID=A0ABS5SIA3_9BACT|nr:hypothetical protein [Geomobilimonas luticola]MBT0654404.1 hypothetical protein [Geomobilimonas luticola]